MDFYGTDFVLGNNRVDTERLPNRTKIYRIQGKLYLLCINKYLPATINFWFGYISVVYLI